ncbi:MAG: hypothetical protein E6K18_08070 [Methanobacteriota archaeon]|nr:MAG: hypothetical protein E6K18_08070 [Euryarchaeota archaeon]
MFGENMAVLMYRMHYDGKIGPSLSHDQKKALAEKISDLTLNHPFQFSGKDYSKKFPELAPLVNVEISGLYLLAILEGLVADLREAKQ